MAGEEIQGFGGFNIDKMKDAVGSVVGAGDEVADAVAFVREYGDDLVRFVSRLPDLLAAAASALADASDDVGAAAAFLTGGPTSGPGVKSLAGVASDALDACRDELGDARKLFDAVAGAFDKLPIPDGGIGDRIGDAARRFDAVGDRLADVADQLRRLGLAVDKAGHGLADTSDKLKAGGTALSRFSSEPAGRPTDRPAGDGSAGSRPAGQRPAKRPAGARPTGDRPAKRQTGRTPNRQSGDGPATRPR